MNLESEIVQSVFLFICISVGATFMLCAFYSQRFLGKKWYLSIILTLKSTKAANEKKWKKFFWSSLIGVYSLVVAGFLTDSGDNPKWMALIFLFATILLFGYSLLLFANAKKA
jgi:hypothetical protein